MDAHRIGDGYFGLGLIMRREDGGTVVVATREAQSGEDVKLAEALGILEALQFIKENGLRSIIVETDSQACVKAILSKCRSRSYWGKTIEACILLCNSLDKIDIKWTNMNSNHVAHEIACWATKEPDRYWTSKFPKPIFAHIQKDMSL